MRLIARSTLRAFADAHPRARGPLEAWYGEAAAADWRSPHDIKARHGNASVIANNRVVFNIAGNRFRLVVEILYDTRTVFIKFIGTHEEYDQIDAATVEFRRP